MSRPADKSGNVPLLFTVSARAPLHAAGTPSAATGEGEDFDPREDFDPSAQPKQRERRIYRGAVYERGDDCQWHLLHE
jgi:hypothetical protein